MFTSIIEFINMYIFGPGLCAAVFICGIFLLFRLGPFFITKPRKTAAVFSARTGNEGISPYKAMIVALAGTLGVGNIAGVASAIAIGGAGAVFWMLLSAVAAMPIKYAEIVLAVRHRRRESGGKFHGGAYYYMADRGTKPWRASALFFAVLCLCTALTMGCATQSNAIAVSLKSTFGIPPSVCGFALALLIFLSVSGGLSRITSITTRLIPAMSVIYILMSLFVIFTNTHLIGEILGDIVSSAFRPDAACGGIIGFVTSRALRIGVTRGIVSNEAGCGTAPIAHASSSAILPAAQGVWGIFEVFIDTTVICTLTALAVLIAQKHGTLITVDGMDSAIAVFGRFIPFSGIILCAAITVFAFCTTVCWFYYAEESLLYLSKGRHLPCANIILAVIYSLCAAAGASISADIVWSLSDLTVSAMTALNIFAVILSSGEVKRETDEWLKH